MLANVTVAEVRLYTSVLSMNFFYPVLQLKISNCNRAVSYSFVYCKCLICPAYRHLFVSLVQESCTYIVYTVQIGYNEKWHFSSRITDETHRWDARKKGKTLGIYLFHGLEFKINFDEIPANLSLCILPCHNTIYACIHTCMHAYIHTYIHVEVQSTLA